MNLNIYQILCSSEWVSVPAKYVSHTDRHTDIIKVIHFIKTEKSHSGLLKRINPSKPGIQFFNESNTFLYIEESKKKYMIPSWK